MQDFASPSNRPQSTSIEPIILAFEQAWRAASPPPMNDFLSECDPEFKGRLVYELALIDMEYRWRASVCGDSITDPLGGQPAWSDYAEHILEFGDVGQIPAELVAEEYRVRQLWGDRPSQDQFMSAFPRQFPHLPKFLAAIDKELLADGALVPRAHRPTVFAAPDPRAPLRWSDFLLQEHLGSGGFGKVYRATQKSLGQAVAIKSLHKALQRDPRAVEQFIREAQLLAQLNHDGIVGVNGLGQFPGGGYFLVLDWIDGEDLQKRLNRGPLSIETAVRITHAVSEAIQHAHARGVIHGDLKPSNVLIGSGEEVFVTDFGLATMISTAESGNEPICILGGTTAYLAPEVVCGGPVTAAVDVYGLGALLYTLLTGQPPWHGHRTESILAELEARNTPVRPAAIRAEVSDSLSEIVMKCMASKVENRFANAQKVVSELSAYLVSLGS